MRLQGLLKNVIFTLLIVAVSVGMLEFGLRGYYYLRLGSYWYSIDRLVDLKAAGPYYEKNSPIANDLGFSGRGKFDPKKLKNEYRILVLGGSAVAGTPDCNWPDIMAEELNKKILHKHIRVINGGIGGHASSEEKAWLTKWIKLLPDLIIIYDGWNDMYYSHYLPEEYEEQFSISNTYYYATIGRKIERFILECSILSRKTKTFSKKIKSALRTYLAKRKGFVEKDAGSNSDSSSIDQNISKEKSDDKTVSEYIPGRPFNVKLCWRKGVKIKMIDPAIPIQDNMSQIYKTNLQEMATLASRYKINVILILQPDLLYHFISHPEVFKGEEDDMLKVIDHKGFRQDWINTVHLLYPKTYDIKKDIAKNNRNVLGVYAINDIFDKFPKKLNFWSLDSCHQTSEGRKIIGKHIADIVYDKI